MKRILTILAPLLIVAVIALFVLQGGLFIRGEVTRVEDAVDRAQGQLHQIEGFQRLQLRALLRVLRLQARRIELLERLLREAGIPVPEGLDFARAIRQFERLLRGGGLLGPPPGGGGG